MPKDFDPAKAIDLLSPADRSEVASTLVQLRPLDDDDAAEELAASLQGEELVEDAEQAEALADFIVRDLKRRL
jgi:hypothetical protein